MTHSALVATKLRLATQRLHYFLVQAGANCDYAEAESIVDNIFAAAVQAAREERKAEG